METENSKRTELKGKWLREGYSSNSQRYKCSICGKTAYYPFKGRRKLPSYQKPCDYMYCPYCGCEMKVKECKENE